jgi:hypothetical protein
MSSSQVENYCFDYCISLALYFSKKSGKYINEFLEPFVLSSFQNRFVTKILLFIAKIGTIKASPIVLKKQIQLKECLNLNHNLRSNRELRVEIKRRFTKFGDNMFFVFWIGVRLLIYELK